MCVVVGGTLNYALELGLVVLIRYLARVCATLYRRGGHFHGDDSLNILDL